MRSNWEGVKVTCSQWSQGYLHLSVVRSLEWLSNAFISGIKKRKQFWGKNNAKIKHLEHLQKSYKCLKHYLKTCVLLRCLLLQEAFYWSDGQHSWTAQLDSQEDCWQAQCAGCTHLLGETQFRAERDLHLLVQTLRARQVECFSWRYIQI